MLEMAAEIWNARRPAEAAKISRGHRNACTALEAIKEQGHLCCVHSRWGHIGGGALMLQAQPPRSHRVLVVAHGPYVARTAAGDAKSEGSPEVAQGRCGRKIGGAPRMRAGRLGTQHGRGPWNAGREAQAIT